MTDLDAASAIEAVRDLGTVDNGVQLTASQVPDFPEFWYVTGEEGGKPLIGGSAFVVERTTGQAIEVPGSRPPRVNCESVRQRSAQ